MAGEALFGTDWADEIRYRRRRNLNDPRHQRVASFLPVSKAIQVLDKKIQLLIKCPLVKLQLKNAQNLLSRTPPKADKAIRILKPLCKRRDAAWPVFHLMGLALLQRNEYAKAEHFLRKALRKGSNETETGHLLAVVCYNQGKLEEAEELDRAVVEERPEFFEGWLNLGAILRAQAKLDEALKCYQKANQLNPRSAGVAFRIGAIYNDQGVLDKALELFEITLKIDPDYLEAEIEKSKILEKKQRFEEAESCLKSALEKQEGHIGVRITLAEFYKGRGDYEESIEIYKELLGQYPKLAVARINYALCLQELGRFDESEKNYLKALEDRPESHEALSNYVMGVHYNPKRTKEEIFEAHLRWDRMFSAGTEIRRPVPADRDPEKKLRIGFISGGFRQHPVGWMITGALEHLPKEQFEVYCYTTNNIYDSITKRIHARSDMWRSVLGYKDEVIARLIRDDEIDILVELSGHAADSRLKTVILEPAPIIVKWVGGLFNTSGLKAVDYLLSDWYETPAGEEQYYTEKLVRFPDDYICFMPPKYAPEVNELPMEKNGYVTFGCFNNPTKVNTELLDRWAEIMNRVPGSRLFLKSKQYDTKQFTERIVRQLGRQGIERERLIFEGNSTHDVLLGRYNRVDIALDPWPYSGGLSTCEALWMGVPVVTLPGPTFAGRHSTTHLSNAGFADFITSDWDAYVNKAVELASNPQRLSELRSNLRKQVAASPLCDQPRFGFYLAKAFRIMWKQWVDGQEQDNGDWANHIDLQAMARTAGWAPQSSAAPVKGTSPALKSGEPGDSGRQGLSTVDEGEDTITRPLAINGHGSGSSRLTDSGTFQADEALLKIRSKDGTTFCLPNQKDILTSYVLQEQGRWFEPEIAFVRQYLKAGMTAIDAGAGFGVYALDMAHSVGDGGKVYAFEPGHMSLEYLEKSKIDNGFSQIEISRMALANEPGQAFLLPGETPEFSRVADEGKKAIRQTTLDAWWNFSGRPQVDYLKLDINGMETNALQGAGQLLETGSPVIQFALGKEEKSIVGQLKALADMGYECFEYIPGPGVLHAFDPKGGLDGYRQNLLAAKADKVGQLKEAGWIFDDSVTTEEPAAGAWKSWMAKWPWVGNHLLEWNESAQNPENKDYIRALNYICAAERIEVAANDDTAARSRKAAYLLEAAVKLITLHNEAGMGLPVAISLVRVLNMLGKRGQAVQIMKQIMDASQVNSQVLETRLPFMLPVEAQDHAPVKTDFTKWLTVRIVEAWVLLKDHSTWFSGKQEKNLLEVLEGNPETLPRIKTINKMLAARTDTTQQRAVGPTQKKQRGKFIHLCFNHVFAQSLSDLVELANGNSEQQHWLFIEKHQAIAGFDPSISKNPHSRIFDFTTQLDQIASYCLADDVDAVFIHGIFFDWQKQLIHAIGDSKHIGWVLWGGDLYNPIRSNIPIYDYAKHVDSIHSVIEGDMDLCVEVYGAKARYRFGYPIPGLDAKIHETEEAEKEKLIIVGNSGDPSNYHIQILQSLASKKDIGQYQLILPMAYNLHPDYEQRLKAELKKLGLDGQTRFIKSFIDPAGYFDLINKAEMLITAHHRQQAVGNMVTALYCGANTFLRDVIEMDGREMKNPTWEFLNDLSLEPNAYHDLDQTTSLSQIKRINPDVKLKYQSLIVENFGIETRARELIDSCRHILKGNAVVSEP